MNLPQHIKSFFKQLPLKNMKGEYIFTAIVFFLAGGEKTKEIYIRDVKNNWSKTVIGKSYNSAFANRAQGYVNSFRKGTICLTDEGIEYIESLFLSPSATNARLIVFKKGNTHTFDKFLRKIFKEAKISIDIADTYVAGNIFDNLLGEAHKKIPIRVLYGNDTGGFVTQSKRFAKEYKFKSKKSQQFHDRFLVIDNKGYIIGPSLKDAADKKPATLVILNSADSKKIVDLFSELWIGK